MEDRVLWKVDTLGATTADITDLALEISSKANSSHDHEWLAVWRPEG
jgi:hypothetical protein